MADYSLDRPKAPAASGWTLRGMVAVAESPIGKSVINWSNSRSCPRLLQASTVAFSGTHCRVLDRHAGSALTYHQSHNVGSEANELSGCAKG
jgi:hypothetical protein